MPRPKKKFFVRESRGHPPPLHPPSTFMLLGPNAEKMTQIGGCFRISFHRALDEVCFSTFLIPLMERLIPDRGQLNPFLCEISGSRELQCRPLKNQWGSNGINEIKGKSTFGQALGRGIGRFVEIFPDPPEDFREFPGFSGDFGEFSGIFEIFREFPRIPGIFPRKT